MGAPFRTPSPPPITAPDHTGVRQPDAVYWAEPAPRIGELVSAWSNQTTSGFETQRSFRALLLLTVILGVMAIAVVIGVHEWLGLAGAAASVVVLGLLVAAGIFESKSRPWCSYLGEDGFSEHKVTWRRTEHTVVRFENVAGLWITRTEHYTNGVYQHTIEEYEWRDKAGLRLAHRRATLHERGLAAAGARFGSGGKVLRNPTRELMTAAAAVWREKRAQQAVDELGDSGVAVFPTLRGGFFSVRDGSVETDVSGKPKTITAADVVSKKLDAGVLTLKTRDGKIRFSVSDVADNTVAFALASQHAGLSLLD